MPSGNRPTPNQNTVKIIDRRTRYEKDVGSVINNPNLSKGEVDKSLEKLRKDFITDLAKIVNTDTAKEIKGLRDDLKKSQSKSEYTNSILTQNLSKMSSDDDKLTRMIADFKSNINLWMGGGSLTAGTGGVLNALKKIYDVAGQIASSINGLFTDSINKAIDQQMSIMGQINGRLYGLNQQFNTASEDDHNFYKDLNDDLAAKFMRNSFIQQESLWAKVKGLVDKGIGFNLEERAYIQELAEKTVTTFSVDNAELLRNIRLNQFDLTTAQFGSEGLLTKFFNQYFQDSSYLSDQYDSVYGAISDALSQMNYGDATEFNYTVQKWLGSLYSVGASAGFIGQLASGLNMLATGDVSGLEGNQALQNMFVMAATKAGMSYSDILTNGLTSEKVDTLMTSMVSYLQDIANNTDNEVVKNAWKGIVGVGVSDLRAIQNINDLGAIAGNSMSFSQALDSATHQAALFEGSNRVSAAQRIQNQMNNLLYSVGSELVNNAGMYEEYRKVQIVESVLNSMSGSLGFIGDIAEDVMSPILAIMEGRVLEDAYSTVMDRAGFGMSNADRAQMIETVGRVLDTNTGQTANTESVVANIRQFSSGDKTKALQWMTDNGMLGSRYSGDDESVNQFLNDLYALGFEMAEWSGPDSSILEQSVVPMFGNIADIIGQEDNPKANNYTGYHQDSATWYWKDTNGGGITPQEWLALTQGVQASPSQAGVTHDEAGEAATLDETVAEVANSYAHYGFLSMLGDFLQTGWDLIDNGMGINPFSRTNAYTRRGEQLYALNALGGRTGNVVGTQSGFLSSIGGSSIVTPSVVSGGLSSSYEMIADTSTAFQTLSNNEAQMTAAAQTISSVQEDNSKSLQELYEALFVEGRSVNVNVQAISEAVAAALTTSVIGGTSAIDAKLEAGIEVNIANGGNTDYFSAVSNMKGW